MNAICLLDSCYSMTDTPAQNPILKRNVYKHFMK